MPESNHRVAKHHGLHLRAIAGVMAALAATVLACAGAAFLFWHDAPAPRQLAPNASPPDVAVAGVPLEASPRAVREAYCAEKDRLLHAREWIDADAGIARIPIDAAMQALAERDAQRRDAATPPRPTP